MRNVDIHQCDHKMTHPPIFVSRWQMRYKIHGVRPPALRIAELLSLPSF
ncbi:hypothetical protein MEZE111188_17205 [Mesobacillus zeae]